MSDHPPAGIDPRGPRFGAAITAVLLIAIAIAGPTTLGVTLLVIQTLAFAAGALLGLQYQPWGWVYRTFVRPRLQAPKELEDPRPPRFAQAVGLGFALVALIGALAGWPVVFYAAVSAALVAALLNAIFDYCLGCEMYLLFQRLGRRSARAAGAKP